MADQRIEPDRRGVKACHAHGSRRREVRHG
jgi:hypothetical protein